MQLIRCRRRLVISPSAMQSNARNNSSEWSCTHDLYWFECVVLERSPGEDRTCDWLYYNHSGHWANRVNTSHLANLQPRNTQPWHQESSSRQTMDWCDMEIFLFVICQISFFYLSTLLSGDKRNYEAQRCNWRTRCPIYFSWEHPV